MAISSLFARHPRRSLLRDILAGAAGGALGTLCLSLTFKLADRIQPLSGEPRPEDPVESPTEKAARKALGPAGIPLEGKRKERAGRALHWGYGLAWGGLYGAMHRRIPQTGRLFGLGFGLGLFLLGDAVLLPALRLTPPLRKLPLRASLNSLAGHLAFGSATEATWRLFRRARA